MDIDGWRPSSWLSGRDKSTIRDTNEPMLQRRTMSDTAIRVESLSKQYRIGLAHRHDTLRDQITDSLRSIFGSNGHDPASGERSDSPDTIWALKDVSFEIKHGEVVGFIGKNGAGKSTLLKILSRITEPTAGRAEIFGRVGSLLEVGTGFHAELTGRENVYLNGAILGMRKGEIERKFDEIVAFAEIEKFLDTPVKRYSSGMYVRLAFAVAAHLEPEILIVDEVLAVGDAGFQKKCLGKMGEVAKQGRTVLFVSHNMGALMRLCERALWIHEGRIVLSGSSNEVVGRYLSGNSSACVEWQRPSGERSTGDFWFEKVRVTNADGLPSGVFAGDEPISIEIRYSVRRALSGCQIGARILNSQGLVVFSTADSDSAQTSALPKDAGGYCSSFTVPGGFLAPNTYSLFIAAHLPYRTIYDLVELTVTFEVSSSGSLASLDGREGIVTPLLAWQIQKESLV